LACICVSTAEMLRQFSIQLPMLKPVCKTGDASTSSSASVRWCCRAADAPPEGGGGHEPTHSGVLRLAAQLREILAKMNESRQVSIPSGPHMLLLLGDVSCCCCLAMFHAAAAWPCVMLLLLGQLSCHGE